MTRPEAHDEEMENPRSARNVRDMNAHNVSSIRMIKDRAMLIHADNARSIGGRLGGHLDSIRTLLDIHADDALGESSRLLTSPTASGRGPPLAHWIAPALFCAAAYAFYNIFIKKGSCCVHPLLGAVILQFVAAMLGSALLRLIVWKGGDDDSSEIHYDRIGLGWSVCAGLAVGSAEMLSFFVSSLGVQASQFIPIIIGGSVMFGAVLGLIILGETMMLHGWSGIILLVTGIALVATDAGKKIEEVGAHDELAGGPPPLVVWIGPALICAMAYAFYNIFIKKGSASINPILGGVVLQFVAAIFGSILLAGTAVARGMEDLTVTEVGMFWACCAGAAVGGAELLSFCVSGMGVDASKSIPIIIGGSVMFGAVLGLIILGETLLFQGWAGVGLLMVGIALVATDPGEKMAGH